MEFSVNFRDIKEIPFDFHRKSTSHKTRWRAGGRKLYASL